MIITKHGSNYIETAHLVCDSCGCEFDEDINELWCYDGESFMLAETVKLAQVECPECHNFVTWMKRINNNEEQE